MLKRPRDSYDTPESSSPPLAGPASPSPPRSAPHLHPLLDSSPYALRTPYSAPTDSPSNPFGLKRSLYALDLPKVSSFSRHTPIRMQVVIDGDTARRTRGGVHRVVQIPNNYTFRHLHKLILFLFASDIDTPSSKGKARATSTSTSTTWAGHYFQVLKDVSLYPESKLPGVMKPDGTTYAKLSSVRDRKLFRDLCDPSPFNATTEDASLPAMLEDEDTNANGDGERGEWTWEAEDDFTIGHVWPRGPEIDRGIIYHHSPTLRLHITINTLPIPPRRGSSNSPFVFAAQGSVGPLIQIAHTVPDVYGNESYYEPCVSSYSSSSTANSSTAKSKSKSKSLTPFSPSPSYTLTPTPLPKTTIERWNAPGAFAAFLASEAERERALRLPRSFDFEGSGGFGCEFEARWRRGAPTPFPSNVYRKKRLERLGRRMERLVRRGLGVFGEGEKARKRKGKERANEDENEHAREQLREKRERRKERGKPGPGPGSCVVGGERGWERGRGWGWLLREREEEEEREEEDPFGDEEPV
ncbi:hypothetical protein BC629DRAFT_1539185 [Irpex lacteus]|nr:hypothetical protein BC629DRAFT_1539185 [Irpex lacteus]